MPDMICIRKVKILGHWFSPSGRHIGSRVDASLSGRVFSSSSSSSSLFSAQRSCVSSQHMPIYFKSGLWSRSQRLGLETHQSLVSVSSREKLSTSRSRLGFGRQNSRSRLGLGHLRLVPNCPRPIFGQIVQATVRSVNGL